MLRILSRDNIIIQYSGVLSNIELLLQLMVERQTDHPGATSFLLRPFDDPPRSINIQHSFLSGHSHQQTTTVAACRALPVFNHDQLFFTPAFILNLDHNYYQLNCGFEGQKFEQRKQVSVQQIQKQDLYLPQPTSDFCQICRQTYPNYHQHISSKPHLRNLRPTKGNKYLNQLCLTFTRMNQPRQKKDMGKNRPTRSHNTRKAKKKAENGDPRNKSRNHNFSRQLQVDSNRLPVTTQISFDKE